MRCGGSPGRALASIVWRAPGSFADVSIPRHGFSLSAPFPPDAEPFDIPGTRLSHHQGRCSFATFLAAYDLQDPVLARIARIVDEADTVQEVELEPAAAGVDLVCRGLRRISPDDHIAVDHGVTLYDALYAQLEAEG